MEEVLSHGEIKTCQEESDWEETLDQDQCKGEVRSCQAVSDWEGDMEEEQCRGEVKKYQEVSDWEENIGQELPQEGSNEGASKREESREDEQSQEEVSSYQELLSNWEYSIEEYDSQESLSSCPELTDRQNSSLEMPSQGKFSSYQDLLTSWEPSIVEYGSQENVSSYSELTDRPNSSLEMPSQGKFSSYQDLLTSWEASTAQGLSQEVSKEDNSIGQDFSDWGDYRPSMLAQSEDDSDTGLALEGWEHMTVHGIEVKPLRPEEDEWEELSVLELSQGEVRGERQGMAGAEGLSVPAPREAWAERRAPEPCTQVPVCACPAQLAAQSPRGAAAGAALEEQGAEAGTRSQGPAPQSPCCPPSPSPPQLQAQALSGQLAVPKARPSFVRRALRALRSLFCSCLAGQPQD